MVNEIGNGNFNDWIDRLRSELASCQFNFEILIEVTSNFTAQQLIIPPMTLGN